MKKRITPIILILLLISSLQLSLAQQDPGDVSQVLEDEFNIDVDKIPKDTETLRREYLQQEWTRVVTESKVLGPVHRTFTKGSFVFSFFFAWPYEISVDFFAIIIAWLFVAYHQEKLLLGTKLNHWKVFVIAIAGATILSHIALKFLVPALLDLAFNRDTFWMRLIITIAIIGGIAGIHIAGRIFEKKLAKRKIKQRESQTEQQLKEVKAFTTELHKKY